MFVLVLWLVYSEVCGLLDLPAGLVCGFVWVLWSIDCVWICCFFCLGALLWILFAGWCFLVVFLVAVRLDYLVSVYWGGCFWWVFDCDLCTVSSAGFGWVHIFV